MIFVTTGSTEAPFQRLVDAAEHLCAVDEVVVQYGAARAIPAVDRAFATASYAEMLTLFQEAQVVVCHGGVGSIAASLSAGKRPVVVPRRKHLNENLDDHQYDLCLRLAQHHFVSLVEDVASLVDAARYHLPNPPQSGLSPELADSISEALARCRARRRCS